MFTAKGVIKIKDLITIKDLMEVKEVLYIETPVLPILKLRALTAWIPISFLFP